MSIGIVRERYTTIETTDFPGQGNAHHRYVIQTLADPSDVVGSIVFQNGPIKEVGVNGLSHEDLIAIVIHRLKAFQTSAYECRENALAITKLEEALHWLDHRTRAREDKGIEGTHAI